MYDDGDDYQEDEYTEADEAIASAESDEDDVADSLEEWDDDDA